MRLAGGFALLPGRHETSLIVERLPFLAMHNQRPRAHGNGPAIVAAQVAGDIARLVLRLAPELEGAVAQVAHIVGQQEGRVIVAQQLGQGEIDVEQFAGRRRAEQRGRCMVEETVVPLFRRHQHARRPRPRRLQRLQLGQPAAGFLQCAQQFLSALVSFSHSATPRPGDIGHHGETSYRSLLFVNDCCYGSTTIPDCQ